MTALTRYTLAATAAILAGLASPAHAAVANRTDTVSAPGACTANAPTTAIRYAVTGIRHAGTTSFYVSCSLRNNWTGSPAGGSGTGTHQAFVLFRNGSTTAQTIRCVLYPGISYDGSTVNGGSFPTSKTIAAGTSDYLEWDSVAMIGGGARFANLNFSCGLPPGVTLTYIDDYYDEDVGT